MSETVNQSGRVAFVVNLSEVDLSAAGLKRLPICCTGSWVKGGERFGYSWADLKSIADNFATWQEASAAGGGKDEIVVDYEHASEMTWMAQGGPAPAAAWIRSIEAPKPGDKFLYAMLDFTDEARELIQTKKYRYLSPSIVEHYRNKRTGKDQGATLTSAALTNKPFLDDLPPICLNDRGFVPVEAHTSPTTHIPTSGTKENTMPKKVKVTAIKSGDNQGHVAISHPDLPTDSSYYADKDDVQDALSECGNNMSEAAARTLSEATGLKGKNFGDQVAAIRDRFQTRVLTLSEVPTKKDGPDKGAPDLDAFSPADGTVVSAEVFTAGQRERLLSEAVTEGRIQPQERPHLRKMLLSDLRDYLGARQKGAAVDTGERGVADGGGASGSGGNAKDDFMGECKRILSEGKHAKSMADAMRYVSGQNAELRKRYDDSIRAATKS